MRYYIADSHFFHGALNTRMDRRGFESAEAMNEYMLEKWNGRVRNCDEVVILGELSWGKAEETNNLLKRLNGRLCLITGNHDKFLTNRAYDSARFEWIKPYEELHDNRRKVVLCHYPILCYNGQYLLDKKARTYMLYGHVHDTYDERLVGEFVQLTRNSRRQSFDGEISIPCNLINCFCMYSDYEPLTLDEWIENDRIRRRLWNNRMEGRI